MDLSLEKYKKILWENQISPSLHRLRILEYLDTHRNHPTVDDIFNALIDEIPTLSRTTVYNTMKKFMEHNLIDELHVFSNESRFDLSYTPHAHYKCEECGKIIDLSNTFLPDGLDRIEGNKVRKHYTYFLGVCKDCEKEGKKK
jgi:Fur family transcriptional regulator, peroxide stress response regulator